MKDMLEDYLDYGIFKIIFCIIGGLVTGVLFIIAANLAIQFLPYKLRFEVLDVFRPIQVFLIYYTMVCSLFFVSACDTVLSWKEIFIPYGVLNLLYGDDGIRYTYYGSDAVYFMLFSFVFSLIAFVFKLILTLILFIYIPIIKLSYLLFASPVYFLLRNRL